MKIKLTVKARDNRNEMHFEVQRKLRATVHRNKKTYSRKNYKLSNYMD